jgi:hypothetical protein
MIETESIFSNDAKKLHSTSLNIANKKSQVAENLKNKLNKSIQYTKLKSIGFNSATCSDFSLKSTLLVKKVNKEEENNKTAKEEISTVSKKEPVTNRLSSLLADYSSDESAENKDDPT